VDEQGIAEVLFEEPLGLLLADLNEVDEKLHLSIELTIESADE